MKKPKGKGALRREPPKREPYDLVLIVTEGEKTEPNYLNGLIDHLELSTANIVVIPDADSDPPSIIDFCENIQKAAKKSGEAYDRLCCVFDGDVKHRCDAARDKALRSKEKFLCYVTTPCFEYWLLLHFEFTRQPFAATPNSTACASVIRRLKNHIPDYEKGALNIFSQVRERLATAISNGGRSLAESNADGEPNPSTEIHLLVEYLRELANR